MLFIEESSTQSYETLSLNICLQFKFSFREKSITTLKSQKFQSDIQVCCKKFLKIHHTRNMFP